MGTAFFYSFAIPRNLGYISDELPSGTACALVSTPYCTNDYDKLSQEDMIRSCAKAEIANRQITFV
jgi:hypothetical protein